MDNTDLAKIERLDDTVKGVTMGDPDGPFRFIETLGVEVPTYIEPRKDLMAASVRDREGAFQYLDYHVPFQLRADFKPEQWPLEYYQKVRGSTRVNTEGFALCAGLTKSTGQLCQCKAVNRTPFCRSHGGALHPADKKLSIKVSNSMEIPEERVARLDRVAQFMQGFISVEDLDDDEVTGNFVRSSAGNPIKGKALGIKFEQSISKELHRRLNDYLKSKAPRMLEVMYQIADSDIVEPADRIKAAQWIAERVIGKTPDVLVNVQSEKPYEGIMDSIQSGSREDYRKTIASGRSLENGGRIGNDYSQAMVVDEVSYSGMDVEEDDSEEFGDAESGYSTQGDERERDFSGEEQGQGKVNDVSAHLESVSGSGFSSSGDDDGDGDSVKIGDSGLEVLSRSEELQAKRIDANAARDRLKKAKARRYAARAVGAFSVNDMPLMIEWKIIDNINNENFGCFHMKMILPENLTEAVVDRVQRSNDPETQAARLEAAAAKLAGRAVAS